MNKLIKQLKQNDNDFEFYPTTDEILNCILESNNFKRSENFSILDVCAGNGESLLKLAKGLRRDYNVCNLYAVEISSMLRSLFINTEINLLGTDFFDFSMVENKMDIIFCNPPFSIYEKFVTKILNESLGDTNLFFVLPTRWKDNKEIQSVIKNKNLEYTILLTTDFLNGDRAARCNVDVIHIKILHNVDPLTSYLEGIFSNRTRESVTSITPEEIESEVKNQVILKDSDFIKELIFLFERDKTNLHNSLIELSKLPVDILADFDINIVTIRTLLASKLNSLSNKYWKVVVDKLFPASEKLIRKYKNEIVQKITKSRMSFCKSNIHAMAEQVLLFVNQNMEKQVVEVFKDLSWRTDLIQYKSNQKVFIKNVWGDQVENSPVKLAHRIVASRVSVEKSWSNDNSARFAYRSAEFLQDFFVVANSLGYKLADNEVSNLNNYLTYGKTIDIMATSPSGDNIVLMAIKPYKNNNLHIKFNNAFLLKFNVIVGKLEGWLKSPKEVEEEFEVSEKESGELFKSIIKVNNNLLLT